MQRTLEDEENYDTTSVDGDLHHANTNFNQSNVRNKEVTKQNNSILNEGNAASHGTGRVESSSDEASVTEKHDCNAKNVEHGQDTQEVDFIGTERNGNGTFGSDINGMDTAPALDAEAIGTEQIPETEGIATAPVLGEVLETERVLETQSQGHGPRMGNNIDLNQLSQGDDEMHIDGEMNSNVNLILEASQTMSPHRSERHCADSDVGDQMEDTEDGATIRTADLVTSEVPGSWAASTGPGENDSHSPGKENSEKPAVPIHDSDSLVAESENIPPTKSEASSRRDMDRLSEMISIIAPDVGEKFSRAVGSEEQVRPERVVSDSDTEGSSDSDDGNKVGDQGESDAETVGSDRAVSDDRMDEDDETQEDSVG